jgi:hypothetical protein
MQRNRQLRLPEFRPGHVFWLSRGATWLNRDKPRPFVLATRCGPGVIGTLAYGSSRDTEARSGAARVQVNPAPAGVNRNGLTTRTSFYPGILLRETYGGLPEHAGSLGTYLAGLRAALREALGIGRGSCLRPDAPVGSRRGRIVELEPRTAAHLRSPFAALLTGPEYSRVENYHVILPIQPGDGFAAPETVLRIERQDWFALFPGRMNSILLPIPAVQSVWYGERIIRETEHVLDGETLTRIDRALCRYFSLPESGGSAGEVSPTG